LGKIPMARAPSPTRPAISGRATPPDRPDLGSNLVPLGQNLNQIEKEVRSLRRLARTARAKLART
jgi:hypothetical protein